MKRTKKRRVKKAKKRTSMVPATQALHKVAEPKDIVLNSQVRDSGGKVIFDDHTLCSQFLRDYVARTCGWRERPVLPSVIDRAQDSAGL